MVATVSGYAGGSTPAPTYRDIGDHTETVLVAFDRRKVSYRELLDVFWSSHNPRSDPSDTQYRNVVFAETDAQFAAAAASKAQVEKRLGRPSPTAVERVGTFFPAEDYHQKFYLRQNKDLEREFRKKYPAEVDFVASTLAARLNGRLGGNGTAAQFEKAMEELLGKKR